MKRIVYRKVSSGASDIVVSPTREFFGTEEEYTDTIAWEENTTHVIEHKMALPFVLAHLVTQQCPTALLEILLPSYLFPSDHHEDEPDGRKVEEIEVEFERFFEEFGDVVAFLH